MELTFQNFINWLSTYFFGGSLTLTGLVLLMQCWAVFLVILINQKAPATYSVVPMIPLQIFFASYGILNSTISILIVIVSAAMVATEMKRVVD